MTEEISFMKQNYLIRSFSKMYVSVQKLKKMVTMGYTRTPLINIYVYNIYVCVCVCVCVFV